jgi:hypothetical protein
LTDTCEHLFTDTRDICMSQRFVTTVFWTFWVRHNVLSAFAFSTVFYFGFGKPKRIFASTLGKSQRVFASVLGNLGDLSWFVKIKMVLLRFWETLTICFNLWN